MNEALGGRRVAFFGGSFDPPHLGHLAVARAARIALRLDTVLFAPVGAQPLKPQGSATPFEDRAAMTRLAIAGEPAFELSLADAPKPSGIPNYTLETLKSLRAERTPESELYCLMGADSFMGLHHWWRAAEIPFLAPLIVASRPGQQLGDLAAALPAGLVIDNTPGRDLTSPEVELRCWSLRNPVGDRADFYLLPGLDVDISASEIRAQLRDPQSGMTAEARIPAPVAEYIRAHGLYR